MRDSVRDRDCSCQKKEKEEREVGNNAHEEKKQRQPAMINGGMRSQRTRPFWLRLWGKKKREGKKSPV